MVVAIHSLPKQAAPSRADIRRQSYAIRRVWTNEERDHRSRLAGLYQQLLLAECLEHQGR